MTEEYFYHYTSEAAAKITKTVPKKPRTAVEAVKPVETLDAAVHAAV